ncbi:MAG: response regulator transcription factor, partial [Deltaproteobacteria bacterium]|nr:response regulator transcription factor [Deltaproteobacteria bacterium]
MGKIKIVLVDDHTVVREGISNSFQKQDDFIIIGEADTGREAIKLVSMNTPDVVIMDISMPDLNGIDATKQILSINPHIKIIALSMYSDKAYVMGMLKAGVSGYLLKTCSFKELLYAIKTVLSGDMFLCEKVTPVVVNSSLESTRNKNKDKTGAKLSQREREVLQLLSEGQNTNTIAEKLNISPKTVSAHIANIKTKLNLYSIAALT